MNPKQKNIVAGILADLRDSANDALQSMPSTWTEQEIRWWLIGRLRQQATTAEKRRYAAFQSDLLNNPRLS